MPRAHRTPLPPRSDPPCLAREALPSEWIVNDMPELAIVERELWETVHARLGVNVGAAQSRAKPRYLLSGWLTCEVCGLKMIVTGGEDRRHYVCGSYHEGGSHACANNLTVLKTLAERELLQPILAMLAQPVVDATVTGVLSKLKAQRRPAVRRTSPEPVKANARLPDLERLVPAVLILLAAGLHVFYVKTQISFTARSAMATKHNITLAIDPALLKKARAVAARRGRSVSALLADELRQLVAEDTQYTTARKRALALLSAPLSLGGRPLSREELHERRCLR